jgi:pimeloyl-ACP methyl ester carboxylesterase
MHPRNHVVLLSFVSVVCAWSSVCSAQSALWPGLDPGPHAVGYRVEHLTDESRSFGGKPDTGRPLQVSIWYPATEMERWTPVTWNDYFLSAATETDFSRPDDARRVRHLDEVRAAAMEAGADPTRFDALLEASTIARGGARPLEGSFPIVIFVPGFGAPAFQNTVACEYLASQGFVVASFPSMGQDSRAMTHDEAGVTAQVRDIAFVIRAVSERYPVQRDRVGLVGYSWGGLTATFAALRGVKVDAVVAIDSTLMVKKGHALARTMEGYAPESIRIPAMLMIAAAKEWKERDVSFFDELSGADAIMLRFHDFTHGDFGSVIQRFFVHTLPDGGGRDIPALEAGYASECRYLGAFFDAYLRDGAEGRNVLLADPPNGVSVERQRPRRSPNADQ